MPRWLSAQPSRWWGYLARAWALLFAASHFSWALGRQRPGPLNRLVAAAGWAVSLLLLLRGVGLEVLLLSGFYESNPALTSSQVHWSLVLWNPWFILGWLTLHVGISVGWLGLSLAMTTLAFTGLLAETHAVRHGAYELMHIFDLIIVIPSVLLSIITGLVVALGTPWGLLEHW